MTTYTLFIDESGDFRTHKGEWLLVGLLLACEPVIAAERLRNNLDPIPSSLSLDGRNDLHLTELRTRFGHETAVGIARTFLKAAASAPGAAGLFAVVNEPKATIGDAETTYRLMLTDLLALVQANLPEGPVVSLQLIVATRTDEHGRRMTMASQISEVVLASLQPSLETGLASRGLVDLVHGGRLGLRLGQAQSYWGLILADFCANLLYNRRYPSSGEVIEELLSDGGLHVFTSLGDFEQRKARIAERDKDYVGALFWWVCAASVGNPAEYQTYLEQLLRNTIDGANFETPHASLEALIERLWQSRRVGGYVLLLQRLTKLQIGMERILEDRTRLYLMPLLFRLQNFMLAVTNHLGDEASSANLVDRQCRVQKELEVQPEQFYLRLEFQLYRIEAAVNSLEFDLACDLARHYLAAVKQYQSAWDALGALGSMAMGKSRLLMKALMNLARCQVLLADPADSAVLKGIDTRLRNLVGAMDHSDDVSRLRNYRVMLQLKQGRPQEALKLIPAVPTENTSPFDLFWAARTVGDAILAGTPGAEQMGKLALDWLQKYDEKFPQERDHPNELIWRERGLLEAHVQGDVREARRCYARSMELTAPKTYHSPMNIWLADLLRLHIATASPGQFYWSETPAIAGTGLRRMTQAAEQLSAGHKDLLLASRRVSVY